MTAVFVFKISVINLDYDLSTDYQCNKCHSVSAAPPGLDYQKDFNFPSQSEAKGYNFIQISRLDTEFCKQTLEDKKYKSHSHHMSAERLEICII